MRRIRHLAALAALITTAGLGVVGILVGAGVVSAPSAGAFLAATGGKVFLFLVGSALVLVAMHYVVILSDRRVNAIVYSRDGELGTVEVTPHAVKEFVAGILRRDIGIDRFGVSLRHAGGGVAIHVRIALPVHQSVTEISQRIQQVLSRYVPERTGVEVRSVSVQVRSIRSNPAAGGAEGGGESAG